MQNNGESGEIIFVPKALSSEILTDTGIINGGKNLEKFSRMVFEENFLKCAVVENRFHI